MPRVTVVSLLSDFGSKDPYVAMMKAVMLEINPSLRIVDITHEVPRFNVRHGAFLLSLAAPYFPSGTIHLAVVDPGVGTERRPIVIKTKRYVFIGPDNGILSLAAERDGVSQAYEIRNERYLREEKSSTFHGRDIFAPVAAYLTRGVLTSEVGPRVWRFNRVSVPVSKRSRNKIVGEIAIIDRFGNLITNIPKEQVRDVRVGAKMMVEVSKRRLGVMLTSTYGGVARGENVALVGSSGFLELGQNQGSIASTLEGVEEGDVVRISL